MNKRIKKKRIRLKNKQLCKRYPFLISRNVWTGKIIKNNYDYTQLDEFPKGWLKAFGYQMLEEIREDCIEHDYLDKLIVFQIKEKFGGLRVYVNFHIKELDELIDKAEQKSFSVCEKCGSEENVTTKPNRPYGWILTLCDNCRK